LKKAAATSSLFEDKRRGNTSDCQENGNDGMVGGKVTEKVVDGCEGSG
jgi:hypothetical protein